MSVKEINREKLIIFLKKAIKEMKKSLNWESFNQNFIKKYSRRELIEILQYYSNDKEIYNLMKKLMDLRVKLASKTSVIIEKNKS